MNLLIAARVASRYLKLSSKALAPDLMGFITLVEKDYKGGMAWLNRFCTDMERAAKAGHAKAVREVAGRNDGLVKELDKVLKGTQKAIADFKKKPCKETAWQLSWPADELHNKVWDPEMFADGQTKADYGRKFEDDLFEPIYEACAKATEFFRRYEVKYEFGSINVTLDAVLPADFEDRLGIDYLKAYHEGGFDDGMKKLLEGLQEAKKAADKNPGGATKGLSVGMALAALKQEADKANDKWTEEFADSLMNVNRSRRSLSPKQKAALEGKLKQYGIPAPNYGKFY